MVHVAKRNANRCPTHPGALLREDVIPATGRTKTEIARLLGISRQHLYDILRERKPVSPAVAVRLGKLFGDGAGVWVRMQAAYDTWNAERKSARFPLSAPKWRRSRYRQFEAVAHDTRRATLEVIARAFKDAGVEFIDENGVGPGLRLRKRHQKKS
jgi:addiction module HigA family antidote